MSTVFTKYFLNTYLYTYSNQANMASAASARYNMMPGMQLVPVSEPVSSESVSDRSKSLKDYHACAKRAGCAKGRKKKTGPARRAPTRRAKETSNIVPLNLQRFKQKARARRPQQTPRRSASTGRFIKTRPGMVPLQTRPGMVPLQTFPPRRR